MDMMLTTKRTFVVVAVMIVCDGSDGRLAAAVIKLLGRWRSA